MRYRLEAAAAGEPDTLQAKLALTAGEALDDARLTMSIEEMDRILDAYDMPQEARNSFREIKQGDGILHWRGLDSQEVFTVFGIHRPTRCGSFKSEMLGYPLEYVTCPKCLALSAADAGEPKD